jgi:hypothetical protein
MSDIAATHNRENGYRRKECGCTGIHKIQSSVERQNRHCHHGERLGPSADHVTSLPQTKDRQIEGERPASPQ